MNYQEALEFLYKALPMFQRVGATAFKKDLSNTLQLCARLGKPQENFKSIHIAGTNGKGSSAHALAAVLQQAGYKTGLYTSPHLKSFRERIRINGIEIPEADVTAFVARHKAYLSELKPSFFEMTVALAFDYFSREKVDYAVIETGMGGRFDSTNVIRPILSLITNIGMDHTQFLGDTLEKIAFEKAGIIKSGVPVVIGETHRLTAPVFREKAEECGASICFADQSFTVTSLGLRRGGDKQHRAVYQIHPALSGLNEIAIDLMGNYQLKNLPAVLKALETLQEVGLDIRAEHILSGLAEIRQKTGLKGRWQIIGEDPLTICDTGHNADGFRSILSQLKEMGPQRLFMVLGMVEDKDHEQILSMLPKHAEYVFCQADQPRSLPAQSLLEKCEKFGLAGRCIPDVNEALAYARKAAAAGDVVFVGGSTFVVAELMEV
ncbi:dihydrofolate synthase / folylpolyglutamate synthase [Cyclobacterium lianum]|uniref:Dihydrofolate synthase/folylpolyglutamate synthase n=1 Tax=Cyclobacterium lianum TaxID=388280 RepID=A0A1M7M568_9BACT|nr:folylpolyglutamate synthase/dihydrofolate synthase family protein [Cyclobacterium lianum]SHM85829.1 dihydrofolate synthase / folylpolyglutamate synthase [Cyclobacterium lianum]